jgi:hypothetical protein
MSWIPVVATALGAVIGLGAGLLIDQVRSRREDTQKWLAARRDAYVSYLSSLHDANEAMRAVSLGEYSPDLTRSAAARAAFRDAGLTQAREQIILLAPEAVIIAADEAFRSLRALRDRIGQGEGLADYEPVLSDYAGRLQALRDAVRRDLGVQGSSPQIPL